MITFRLLACLVAVGLPLVLGSATIKAQSAPPEGALKPSEDWPCWRGPNHNGVVASTKKWLTTWPAEGPKTLWTAPIGRGHSSLAVAGGRVFASGWGDPKVVGKPHWDTLYCFDAETGAALWTAPLPSTGENTYLGTAPTPAVGGDVVVAISNGGGVAGFDVKTGEALWTRDMPLDFGSKAPSYCWASSPQIVGEVVILGGGTRGIGLDRRTGKTVWQSGPSMSVCISPLPCQVDGQEAVILMTRNELSLIRPTDGSVIYGSATKDISWRVRSPLYGDPVILGRQIELSGIWLTLDDGQVKWSQQNDQRNYAHAVFSQPVLFQGRVYGANELEHRGVYSKLEHMSLRCRDWATGKVVWDKQGVAGQPIVVDGVLMVFGIDSTLTLVKTGADQYDELARAVIFPGYVDGEQGTHAVTAPAFAAGCVYLRKNEKIVCVDLRD